jgi:hypothetical protein
MKALIITISMASLLAAGAASASVSFNPDRVGDSSTQTTIHYNNEVVVIVDGPNMPGDDYGHKFLIRGN